MIRLPSNNVIRQRTQSSNVQIYHNRPFPLRDIVDILYPLFTTSYQYDELIRMITTVNHIFCSYDHIQRRCIACALVNEVGTKGGLYIMLFGVRQSSQHHGVGTKLLKGIIEWARQRKYTYIYLHVNVDNYKAIGLYRKVGFRQHEYLPDYYRDSPKESPAGYRMILSLN